MGMIAAAGTIILSLIAYDFAVNDRDLLAKDRVDWTLFGLVRPFVALVSACLLVAASTTYPAEAAGQLQALRNKLLRGAVHWRQREDALPAHRDRSRSISCSTSWPNAVGRTSMPSWPPSDLGLDGIEAAAILELSLPRQVEKTANWRIVGGRALAFEHCKNRLQDKTS